MSLRGICNFKWVEKLLHPTPQSKVANPTQPQQAKASAPQASAPGVPPSAPHCTLHERAPNGDRYHPACGIFE